MNSRDRILTATACQQPDRVPICLYFHQTRTDRPRPAAWRWRDQFEKAEAVLALGADDLVRVHVPWALPPDVEVKAWREEAPGQPYPLLVGEYHTPRGRLRQVVRETADWPHGLEMPLFSDHAVSRATDWWVEDEADLEALSYLLGPPTDAQVERFRQECRHVRQAADRLGVAVEGECTMGGDAAAWLMGFENLMLAAVERPAFVKDLLAIIHHWEMGRLELLLESDVDIVRRRAWYESADLWSPPLYREVLAPLVKEEVELTHQAGKLYVYIMTTGIMPLLGDIRDSGVDALWGIDPVQGGADLGRVKEQIGGDVCLWGGVNGAVTVARGGAEAIRAAVGEACGALAPGGGFVLFPVDAVFEDCPWENVLAFIAAGREFGRYG